MPIYINHITPHRGVQLASIPPPLRPRRLTSTRATGARAQPRAYGYSSTSRTTTIISSIATAAMTTQAPML